MTALEKINAPPTRLGGTALYDWDELVQEDRVHRLIYTDPAIFEAEMTNIFGGTWTYLAHESEIPNDNDFITATLRLAAADHRARRQRQNPRAVQPLHPSRHHAVPLGQGQREIVPVPVSRLELPQHRQAARRAVAGRLCRRHARSEIQRRAGAAGRILSRLHLRHAQHGRAAAHRASRSDRKDRSTSGSTAIPAARSWCARRTGLSTRATGSSPTTIRATAITSSIRTARCWRPRTASPARTPRACPITATRPTPSRCTCAIPATAITSRTSGRTSKNARAACGRWKARIPAWSTTKPSSSGATATAPSRCSISPAPSRSTSTCFRIFPCSATTSRCSSRSASTRPTPSGTAP